jgi:hypothetical protein
MPSVAHKAAGGGDCQVSQVIAWAMGLIGTGAAGTPRMCTLEHDGRDSRSERSGKGKSQEGQSDSFLDNSRHRNSGVKDSRHGDQT